MKNEIENAEHRGLVGPDTIILRAVAGRGPLARAFEQLHLRPTRVRFVNTAAAPITITAATFDPAYDTTSGAAAEVALAAEVSGLAPVPGEPVTVALHGRVPARAGIYRSNLRLAVVGGEPSVTPLEIRVSVHPAWGFACLMLGLLLVGLDALLESESDLRRQRHDALQLRQQVHETLAQVPAPLVSALPVAVIDREIDQALVLLGQGRSWSFVDRRVAEAKLHLDAAQSQADTMQGSVAGHAIGAADSASLEQRWKELHGIFTELARQFPVSVPTGDTFAERFETYNAWVAQCVLAPWLDQAGIRFPYDLARVQLLYAAGRDTEAANLANTTRRGMQRSADSVREQAELLAFYRRTSIDNLMTEQRLRLHLASALISPERRVSITRTLDEAVALLRPPYASDMGRRVNLRIEESVTEMFRAEQEVALAAVAAARAREEAEDSIESIQAIIDRGATLPRGADGRIAPEAKFAWLQQVAGEWRIRLAGFPEPNPPGLLAALEGFEQAIAGRNTNDISARLRTLTDRWQGYSTERARAMINQAVAPFCLSLRERIFAGIMAIRGNLQELGAHPQLKQWENQLEALRMKAAATPESVERMHVGTLDELSALYTSVSGFSNEVSSAQWDRIALTPSARRWLVDQLGDMLTKSTRENLLGAVRVLRIDVLTPFDEQYAGREFRFQIMNLDPAWKHGVQLRLEFGDGATQILNSEELAQNSAFTHAYARQGRYRLRACAIPCVVPAQGGEPPDVLGATPEQPQPLEVAASPVSSAARWADAFLNTRHGLALLIAVALYFWRFQAKTTTFGASALDYAQAFSLGIAASLAVNKLPDVIAGLFS
jgi:hypothetical protein